MYKLLLVDDEIEVRKGIISKIDWTQTGFEIVGEAENGLEALEVMEKLNPDVAIIDIKMPFMDGMQLAERISSDYPATKLMILSGFDEFDYAQRAIRYNVMEYILKPLSADELMEVLQRLKTVLDEEKEKNANMEALRLQYMDSLPLLKERFLNVMIMEHMEVEEIYERAGRFNIHLPQGPMTLALVAHSHDRSEVRELHEATMSPYEERELHGYAVFETCERIGDQHGVTTFMRAGGETVMILPIDEEDLKASYAVLEEVRMVIEKTHPLTVTVGVGQVVHSPTDLKDALQGAMSALDHRLVEGTNRLLFIHDLLPKDYGQLIFQDEMERDLRTTIRTAGEKEIEALIQKHFQVMRVREISYQDCRLFINEMLTSLFRIARAHDLNLHEVTGRDNLFAEMEDMDVLDNLEAWFITICLLLKAQILQSRTSGMQEIVARAKGHVLDHFHESDLTLETMSSVLHISPSYFSRVFKKESGKTFIQYLTQVRMDKAMEYILNTDMKNFEIAEKIGYAEANYFSYSFKKYFGQSPTAVKKQKKKKV